MDKDVRVILRRVIIDCLILGSVALPLLIFKIWGTPYKRGFFCNDESLKHPFKDSTVTSEMLYVTGFAVPIAIFLATEFRHHHGTRSIGSKPVPLWVWESYKIIGIFLFGAACSQLTTDIAKYTIGRLRPHFFDICQPDIDCNLAENKHVYHEAFVCTNRQVSAFRLKEIRLSFLSGHSSFSAYTMVFLVMYLQMRWNRRFSTLLRHFLQFLALTMAWYTALTRVSDYKHHWSDCLAGSAQGALVAILIVTCVSGLTKKRPNLDSSGSLPMVQPGTNSSIDT
ncbi:putative phosphatidate phosphatase [Neocloeon triangulifer]|uniref:putative phosphatidate phosphatase n=1 Tax=Neocloeon triangulifer TaxID=2078957 RepID=UPI00286F56D6|nr:putative phosphatidate phosphatase [Neocloeon triangulifer]